MRWLSILVVALALVAAGCGGSDDESSATDETTVEETLTDETSTDDSTTRRDDRNRHLGPPGRRGLRRARQCRCVDRGGVLRRRRQWEPGGSRRAREQGSRRDQGRCPNARRGLCDVLGEDQGHRDRARSDPERRSSCRSSRLRSPRWIKRSSQRHRSVSRRGRRRTARVDTADRASASADTRSRTSLKAPAGRGRRPLASRPQLRF